ncbi:MAG: DUF2520 domain-containing protein, partial [Myxococcales bacterium]|nr:DUF2520 domain-containing protein [Myxococcales bacterium]
AAALASVGIGILRGLGLGGAEASRAVAGLLHSVAENVDRIGLPSSLTGPIARGDAHTVRRHREALRASPAALDAYDRIGPLILNCAREAGLDEEAAARIEGALRASFDGPGDEAS